MRFASWSHRRNIAAVVYQGLTTAPENWQHAQNRLADWLQTLPPQTGIIAVTDARARHVLQVCDHLHIPVPEKLCVIGIDNEELTRYLSRVALSSVAGNPADGLSGGETAASPAGQRADAAAASAGSTGTRGGATLNGLPLPE
jgi:DNA-binding LacI/PurR family transcriptional regulator